MIDTRLRIGGIVFQGFLLAVAPLAARSQESGAAYSQRELEDMKNRLGALERKAAGQGVPPLISGLKEVDWSGYLDVSYLYNLADLDPGAGRANQSRLFDTQVNGFSLHLLALILDKPVSDKSPFGFHADLFMGRGKDNDQFDLQQAYTAIRAPVGAGIDFKVGRYGGLLGPESIQSPRNWNFSRSLLFNYAQPGTHTGVLVSSPLGEHATVQGGISNGWNNVSENNKGKTLTGSLGVKPHPTLELSVNGVVGPERAGNARDQRSVIDLIASWKPLTRLSVMVNYDYGRESRIAPGVGGDGPATEIFGGVALYGKYDLNDRWSLAGRWEWFQDKGNVRAGLVGPGGRAPAGLEETEWTLTSQWTAGQYLMLRLEYRQDRASEPVFFHDSAALSKHQNTIGTEVVARF